MRRVPAITATLAAACSLPLLAACGPAADSTSAEASLSSASAALSSSAAAAISSASAAMSSASAAMSSSASGALGSASQNAVAAPTTAGTQGVSFRMPDTARAGRSRTRRTPSTRTAIFYSKSHDLRGVRHQVLDRDWKVCSQNVPAGQQVTGNAEGAIDFGVVELSETCP